MTRTGRPAGPAPKPRASSNKLRRTGLTFSLQLAAWSLLL